MSLHYPSKHIIKSKFHKLYKYDIFTTIYSTISDTFSFYIVSTNSKSAADVIENILKKKRKSQYIKVKVSKTVSLVGTQSLKF